MRKLPDRRTALPANARLYTFERMPPAPAFDRIDGKAGDFGDLCHRHVPFLSQAIYQGRLFLCHIDHLP
jgi:hypothetical protein